MARQDGHFFQFGPFRLSADDGVLLRDGKAVSLTPKAVDTLVAFLRNKSRVLSKDELIKIIWPDTTVEENNLTQQISTLRRALGPAPNGEQYIENIPRRGYRFTVDVEETWGSQEDSAPRATVVTESVLPPPLPIAAVSEDEQQAPKFGRKTVLVAIVSGTLVIGLLGAVIATRDRGLNNQPKAPPLRPSVAVLPFRNLSKTTEFDWLSTGLAEMSAVDLTAGGRLRIASGDETARMVRDLKLFPTGTLSIDILTQIRKAVGADLVLMGSFAAVGDLRARQIRINVVLQDTITGETIFSANSTGTPANLLRSIEQTSSAVRRQLGIEPPSATEAKAVEAFLPRNSDAQRLYLEGLAKLRRIEGADAITLLGRAISAQPDSPAIHSALSSAWSLLGHKANARLHAKKALDLAAQLRREDLLTIEARYRELANEGGKAIEIYKSLWMVFPDNLEYGLSLSNAQTESGKAKDALSTIAEMRKLPERSAQDPRVDLSEAATAETLGNFELEHAAALRAEEKANEIGSRSVAANALLRQCWALNGLSERTKALASAERARELFRSVGDPGGEARAVKNIADVLDDGGDHSGGEKQYQFALSTFRRIGNNAGVAVVLNNLGHALRNQGKLREAQQRFEEALSISRTIGDEAREALALNGLASIKWRQSDLEGAQTAYERALAIHRSQNDSSRTAIVGGNLAIVLQDRGLLDEAKGRFEDSLAVMRKIGDRSGSARNLGNLGELLLRKGDLSNAKARFLDQLAIASEIGETKQRAYALFGLGQTLLVEGDMRGAKDKHEEAKSLRERLGESGLVAESRMALAAVALEQGNSAQAVAEIRAAIDEFQREKERDEEVHASAFLSKALMTADRKEALRIYDSAHSRADSVKDTSLRLSTLILLADANNLLRGSRNDRKQLEAIRTEAVKGGYRLLDFEARLVLAEVADTDTKSRLEALEREARKAGFGLIARKAETWLRDLNTQQGH